MSTPLWSIDAVWDIECAQWDQFLCGALWTNEHGTRVFHNPDALADALMALPKGTQTWAHAGGKYDTLWLIDHLAKRGDLRRDTAQVTMSGSSATSVRFKDGPWMRDSARLIPMSLARAARIAGPQREKGDPGIPFEDFTLDMPRRKLDRVVDYMVGDVELLRDVLLAIGDYAERHGIELRGTIGGTAWATAKKWCEIDDTEWNAALYNYVRDGYFGGLVAVGQTAAPSIHRYDRKSAYPASLLEPVPVGEPSQLTPSTASRDFARGRPGIYSAIVRVPESIMPPLPIRHRNRLANPHGVITGTWSHVELQHAVDSGCTIEAMVTGVSWLAEEPKLRPYSRKCFRLRDSLDEAGKAGLGIWLKFLANSFTGKLGQSPDFQIVSLGDYADDPSYNQVGSSPWVWSKDQWRIPQCGMVHWAATLTARARVELHEQILHAGSDWVYSDTDSCFATRGLTRRIGESIGKWAYEGEGRAWIAAAPKVYSYYDVKKEKAVAHAKGVPGDSEGSLEIEQWRDYIAGKVVVQERGVHGLKTAARGDSLFRRRRLTRSYHANPEWCGARLRDGTRTRAPNVSDLARLK